MITFTFFDLMSAVRQIRPLKFRTPSQEEIAYPLTVEVLTRTGRTWRITADSDKIFSWDESNIGDVIISEVDGSPIRAVARFGYFDLVDAIRRQRALKFTTGGSDVVTIPHSIKNISRSSQAFIITTSNGTFTWADNNTTGPTVIAEI